MACENKNCYYELPNPLNGNNQLSARIYWPPGKAGSLSHMKAQILQEEFFVFRGIHEVAQK